MAELISETFVGVTSINVPNLYIIREWEENGKIKKYEEKVLFLNIYHTRQVWKDKFEYDNYTAEYSPVVFSDIQSQGYTESSDYNNAKYYLKDKDSLRPLSEKELEKIIKVGFLEQK